jgi:hypothetical protein
VKEPFPPDPIVIRYNARGIVWMILAGVAMAAFAAFFHGLGTATHKVAYDVFAIVLAVIAALGGLCLAAILLWAARPPALVIDSDGIQTNPRRPAERVLWADLKGAHLAVIEIRSSGGFFTIRMRRKIVALDMVDPQAFHRRREAGKRRWLGYDTGLRTEYVPIYYEYLDTEVRRLMYLVNEGIARQGRPDPDPNPQTTYYAFFPEPS